MLSRLMISYFRCLKTVDIPLSPLTVLIGMNDTGKSSFLSAVYLLANANGFAQDDRFRRNASIVTSIIGYLKNGAMVRLTSAEPRKERTDKINPTNLYRLPAHGVSMQSPGYSDHVGAQELGPDGSGVPSLLDYFLRRDRPRFYEVVKAIKELVPGVQEIEIATPTASDRRLDLILDENFRIPADQASAGVRLILFFIALAYHPSPPKIILLEEPENGIHPKRLADVMRLLKGIKRGEHANNSAQVILSTHSPYLLDLVDLEEGQVLIFQRVDDGQCTVTPAHKARLEVFLEDFMLGEVWYNQGEEGMVSKK